MKKSICLLTLLFTVSGLFAQEHTEAEESHEFLQSSVYVDISHAFISQGVTDEGKKFSIEPSWESDTPIS